MYKIHYTGNFRDLKKFGFRFEKLYAENKKVYINENIYPNVYVWVKDKEIRIPDFGVFTAPIIKHCLENNINEDTIFYCNTKTHTVRVSDGSDEEFDYNLYLRLKNDEITKEEHKNIRRNLDRREIFIVKEVLDFFREFEGKFEIR